MPWHDVVGNIGVLLIVSAYFLLQLKWLKSDGLWYSLANGAGALLILVSLVIDYNQSAFIIEIFWLVISAYGIFVWLRRRRRGELERL